MAILQGLKGKYLEGHVVVIAICHTCCSNIYCGVHHSLQGSLPSYEEQKLTDTGPQLTADWWSMTLTGWCTKKILHTKT